MSGLALEARSVADLLWHLLAHLPLGADAASLHDPALAPRPWAHEVTSLYLRAPGRLSVQWAPLWSPDTPEIEADPARTPALVARLLAAFRPLGDGPGAALREALVQAARTEAPTHAARWAERAPARAAALAAAATLADPIARVRAALWAPAPPPPLRVLHAPSLRHHARAATVAGVRVVATSLAEPLDHVICQILHEETHPVSDPAALPPPGEATGAPPPGAPPVTARATPRDARDTRAGTPGHTVHLALERAAVARTEAALRAAAPELLAPFAAWRARFRI